MFTYIPGKLQEIDPTSSVNYERKMHASDSSGGKLARMPKQWNVNTHGNAENLKPSPHHRRGSELQLTATENADYNNRPHTIKIQNVPGSPTLRGLSSPQNSSQTKEYRIRDEHNNPAKFTILKNEFDPRLERVAAYPTNSSVYDSTTPRRNHEKQDWTPYGSMDRARPKSQNNTRITKPQYPVPPKSNEIAPAVPPKSTRPKPRDFAAVVKPLSNGRSDRTQATPLVIESRPSPSSRSSSPPWHSLIRRSIYDRTASRDVPQNGFPTSERQRVSPHAPVHRPSSSAAHRNGPPVASENSLNRPRNGVYNINGRITSRDGPRGFRETAQKSNQRIQSGGTAWTPSSDQGGAPRQSGNVHGDASRSRYPPDVDRQPNGHRSRSSSRQKPSSENIQYDPQSMPLQRHHHQHQVYSSKTDATRALQPPPRPALPKKPASRSTTESASSSNHARPSHPPLPTYRQYFPAYSGSLHKNYYKDEEEDDDDDDEEEEYDGTLRLVSDIDQQGASVYDSPREAVSERIDSHPHRAHPNGSSTRRTEAGRPLRSVSNHNRSSMRRTDVLPVPDYENLEDLKLVMAADGTKQTRSRRPEAGLARKSNNYYNRLPSRTGARNGVSRAGNYSAFPEVANNGHWTRKTFHEGAPKSTHMPAPRHNSSPSRSSRSMLEFRKILEKEVMPGDPRPDLKELGVIGDGSTSVVYLARSRRSGRLLAVKKMSLMKQQRPELLLNEAIVMRAYAHPSIVAMYASYLVGDELWVLMEYMECGALTDIISHVKLTEEQIATICLPVLTALAYLHDHGVIHRDVKSDSVLLSAKGIVKLSDFGFCAKVSAESPRRRSLVGTPYWMAPEVIARIPYFTAADVWSFGVLIIEMVEGEPNLFDDPPSVAMERIKKSFTPHLRFPQMSSPSLNSFLSIILVRQDLHRATAAQLLRHPFLKHAGPPSCLQPLLARVTPEWR